jgi:hypothetical protein
VAHTARDRIEVIDHDTSRHLATLHGFSEAAGVVADEGQVLITNRGAARLAWIDAHTLETRAVFDTGVRPNGVAIVSRLKLAVVARIGDNTHGPVLQVLDLSSRRRWVIDLPGRPRWCVPDAVGAQVFLAIRDPSMVLIARLPELDDVQHWTLHRLAPAELTLITKRSGSTSPVTAAPSWGSKQSPEKYVASGHCQEFRTQRSSIQPAALYMSQ